jgi:Flp pilus assembly protein TadG
MMNERGQALIETAMFFLVFSALMAVFLGFTKWFTIRLKILQATREAALLYSSGRMTSEEVRAQVRRYMTTGSPALAAERIQIELARDSGGWSVVYELDRVTVRYRSESGWYRYVGLNPTMEETCIIKHATHYGPPLQKFLGPPVPY